MTDELTIERLDELEREATLHRNLNLPYKDALRLRTPLWPDEALALIAMAKRTHQAERERDALRGECEALTMTCSSLAEIYDSVRAVVNGRPIDEIRAALAKPTGAGVVNFEEIPHGGDASPYPPMTAVEKEQQRRSFAYGNVHMSNPNVTREMVDEAAERLAGGDA